MAENSVGLQIKPIVQPTSADWNLAIKEADYNRILNGFTPQQMEDRWFCVADKPDAQGNTVLHAARSWTSEEQISLTIDAGKGDVGPRLGKLTWETDNYATEDEAKELAVNICKHLLGCDLENA